MLGFVWPDWFFAETTDTEVAVMLLAFGCILVIWGLGLLWSTILGYRACRKRCEGDAYWDLAFDLCLGFWLFTESSLWFIISYDVIVDPKGIDRWVAMLLTVIALPVLLAFFIWGRGKIVKRRRDHARLP